jgi:broad specificity phosphatase PhoE
MDTLHIDPDLAEQHFGSWQGLTYVEIAENHANNHLFWLDRRNFGPRAARASSTCASARCAASTG